MRVKSLSHVGLTVSNFEKAVDFYSKKFGFRLINEQILEKEQVDTLYELYELKYTQVRLGFLRAPKGAIVEIFEFNPGLPAERTIWNKPGPTHFTLDVHNVQKWYRRLSKEGIRFFSEPQNTNGTDWVFLQDPDGNLIELIDLKFNYMVIRLLGGLVGYIMSKFSFKKYYK